MVQYVDEVLIGAPWAVTRELIEGHKIDIVMHGTVSDTALLTPKDLDGDPYKFAKELGVYKEIKSPSNMTTGDIIDRVFRNIEAYAVFLLVIFSIAFLVVVVVLVVD